MCVLTAFEFASVVTPANAETEYVSLCSHLDAFSFNNIFICTPGNNLSTHTAYVLYINMFV